jgi:hypothetical protein
MTKQEYYLKLIRGELDQPEEPDEFTFIRMLKEQEENRQNGQHDEKTIEIILEANEKHYNLTLVLVTIVPWLVCLVCGALLILGLLWLIGVI